MLQRYFKCVSAAIRCKHTSSVYLLLLGVWSRPLVPLQQPIGFEQFAAGLSVMLPQQLWQPELPQ